MPRSGPGPVTGLPSTRTVPSVAGNCGVRPAISRITVDLPVETKGEAPGEREGGILELVLHEVTIEVSPAALPERLYIDVSELHLNESAGAEKILGLPAGAELKLDENEVIVHCVPPAGEPEEEEAVAAAGGEPEVIGKGQSGDEGEES